MELKQVTLAASAAVTATGNTAPAQNQYATGGNIVINITAVSGTTPAVVFKLQGQDPTSGTWYDVADAALASITASGQYKLVVHPAVTPVTGTNAKASNLLPGTFRLAYTITGTTPSFTFSASAELY